jgi:hypothetical protein
VVRWATRASPPTPPTPGNRALPRGPSRETPRPPEKPGKPDNNVEPVRPETGRDRRDHHQGHDQNDADRGEPRDSADADEEHEPEIKPPHGPPLARRERRVEAEQPELLREEPCGGEQRDRDPREKPCIAPHHAGGFPEDEPVESGLVPPRHPLDDPRQHDPHAEKNTHRDRDRRVLLDPRERPHRRDEPCGKRPKDQGTGEKSDEIPVAHHEKRNAHTRERGVCHRVAHQRPPPQHREAPDHPRRDAQECRPRQHHACVGVLQGQESQKVIHVSREPPPVAPRRTASAASSRRVSRPP